MKPYRYRTAAESRATKKKLRELVSASRDAQGEIMHSIFNHKYKFDRDNCARCVIIDRFDKAIRSARRAVGGSDD